MAMNALRTGAKSGVIKFFLMGLMVMAVAGLVMTDVGGFFRGGVKPTTVAKIGKQELSQQVFDTMARRALRQQGLDLQTAYQLGLLNNILEGEINRTLMYRAAQDHGVTLSSKMIAARVSELLQPFVDEQTTPAQAFRQILLTQSMSEQQFSQQLRMEISMALIRNALGGPAAYVSQGLAEEMYRFQNETREVRGLVFLNKDLAGIEAPSDDELLPLYQAGLERFAVPEQRSFTVAVLTPDTLKESLEISDEALLASYEADRLTYEIPEERIVAQAVFETEQAAQKVALALAGNPEQSVEDAAGDDFIGQDSFRQSGLLPEIAGPVFGGGVGDVIGPVKTPLGWHVLKLEEIQEPRMQAFEDVKDSIKDALIQERLYEDMFALSAQVDDELAAGVPLEEVADTFGMTLHSFGPVTQDGAKLDETEGMDKFEDDSTDILESAFLQMEGESSPVFELSDGSFAVVRVNQIFERTYKPFEDVRAQIEDSWMAEKRDVLTQQQARDALRDLANESVTLESLAAEKGVSVQDFILIRAEETPAPFTTQSLGNLFGEQTGQFAMTSVSGGYFVGRIESISFPEADDIPADDMEELRENLTGGYQEEILGAYLNALYDEYNVKINQDLLARIYGPQSGN